MAYEVAAQNLAQRLDEVRPGWAREIDRERLDMNSPEDCMMGQLFGGYTVGRKAIGVQPHESVAYALDVNDEYGDDAEVLMQAEYNLLEEAILAEIDKRTWDFAPTELTMATV